MHYIEYLASNPLAFSLTCLVFGLLVGSFLNVVIYRLPIMMDRDWVSQCVEFLRDKPDWEVTFKGEKRQDEAETFNLVLPDSHCPQCDKKITALENIPLISYTVLRGKCSACGCKIPIRYPLIELLTGMLVMITGTHFGLGWPALFAILLTCSLVAMTVIDLDHMLLPDSMTMPLIWLGLLLNIQGMFVPLHDAVIGAVAGYLSLWSVYWLFKLLTGKEGMGFGDFKLLAALGAWMGWQSLPLIILLSSLVGAIYGLTAIALKMLAREKPIPFGPYLAMAGWIALLWGDQITRSYLEMSGL